MFTLCVWVCVCVHACVCACMRVCVLVCVCVVDVAIGKNCVYRWMRDWKHFISNRDIAAQRKHTTNIKKWQCKTKCVRHDSAFVFTFMIFIISNKLRKKNHWWSVGQNPDGNGTYGSLQYKGCCTLGAFVLYFLYFQTSGSTLTLKWLISTQIFH